MASTSNRTPINYENPTDHEVRFDGWTRLESVVYDLWLSPCETYLVQHYYPKEEQFIRLMRTGYVHDLNMQDFKLRQMNRMGQIIGYKTYDYQIIHEFTGCHWYGNEDFPDDFSQLLADFDRAEISWPTIRPANLYRNPEGELRVIGAYLCMEDGGIPYNLNFWGEFMTRDERSQANQFTVGQEWNTRLHSNTTQARYRAGTPVNSGEAAVAPTQKI